MTRKLLVLTALLLSAGLLTWVGLGLRQAARELAARQPVPDWQTLSATRQAVDHTSTNRPIASVVDSAGNVYVSGRFEDTIRLGDFALVAKEPATYLARWSRRQHRFDWARTLGPADSVAVSLLVANGAQLYMGGTFRRQLALGDTLVQAADTTNTQFVASVRLLGPATQVQWVQQGPALEPLFWEQVPRLPGLLVAQGNSLYLASGLRGGSQQLGSLTLVSPDTAYQDIVIAKLTNTGRGLRWEWAKRAGGSDIDQVRGLAVQGHDLYLAGNVHGGEADFGACHLTHAGYGGTIDAYVAKLTDQGADAGFCWAMPCGESAAGLCVQGNSVYVAGELEEGGTWFGPYYRRSQGHSDAFVTKLTDQGNAARLEWVQCLGGPDYNDYDDGMAMAVSGKRVYLAGMSDARTLPAGATTMTNINSNPSRTYDVFLARFTDKGSTAHLDWGRSGGSWYFDYPCQLAVVGSTVEIVGTSETSYEDTRLHFGPLSAPGGEDVQSVFVATLTDPPPPTFRQVWRYWWRQHFG